MNLSHPNSIGDTSCPSREKTVLLITILKMLSDLLQDGSVAGNWQEAITLISRKVFGIICKQIIYCFQLSSECPRTNFISGRLFVISLMWWHLTKALVGMPKEQTRTFDFLKKPSDYTLFQIQ